MKYELKLKRVHPANKMRLGRHEITAAYQVFDLNEKEETVVSLNNELEELLALEGDLDRKRITRLAKILESMKPQEAAPVMGQLTDDLNVVILMKMKERPAGKILSEMPVPRAAAISRRISQKVLES